MFILNKNPNLKQCYPCFWSIQGIQLLWFSIVLIHVLPFFFYILYKCTIRQNKVKGMIFWKAHQNVDSGRHVKLLWTIVMKRAV